MADAVAKATGEGDEIHVKGDLTQSNAVQVANHPGLAIRGGYTGEGESRDGRSRLVRDANAGQFLILDVAGSTITLDGLSVEKGYNNVNNTWGEGVCLTNGCTATVTNCAFLANGGGLSQGRRIHGGALAASGGTLTVVDCDFKDNRASGSQIDIWGMGAYAYQATVKVKNSRFRNNYISSGWNGNYNQHGGALGFYECPQVEISGCTFRTNYVYEAFRMQYPENFYGNASGGAIMLYACPTSAVNDCQFFGDHNRAAYSHSSLYQVGSAHAIHVWKSTLALTRSVFHGVGSGSGAPGSGVVDVLGTDGRLYMTNVLMVACRNGWFLGNYKGTIEAVKCTFTDLTKPNATRKYPAYCQYSGSAAFRDCIFWNLNEDGLTYVNRDYGYDPVMVNCTDTTEDPLFGDGTYCHPMSAAGRYVGGWFAGGSFATNDTVTSSTIDAASGFVPAYAAEPQPNGRKANLGYDGNTEVASKSVLDDDPEVVKGQIKVVSYADYTVPDATAVVVYGDLADAGDDAASTVWMVWDNADRGEIFENWTHRVNCGTHAPWDLVSARIEGASGTVYYRFFTQNASTQADWSSPARSLKVPTRPQIAYASPTVAARYRTSAGVRIDVTDTSDLDTYVTVRYWLVSDPTVTNTAVANGGAPVAVETVSAPLTGLEKGTAYGYVATASNSVGVTTLAAQAFTTKTDEEPVTVCAGPAAAGLADGSSFADATTLDAAFALASGAGDEIRLPEGEFELTNGYAVANHPGLAIRGGLAADGTPGAGRTRLARKASAPQFRILTFSASTVTVSGVSIEKGYLDQANVWGQGVGLTGGCDATFTNCAFLANGGWVNQNTWYKGGGLGQEGGRLRIDDCEFLDNSIRRGHSISAWGIGAYARAASVSVKNSRFQNNYSTSGWNGEYDPQGGALAFWGCPDVAIDGCTFRTNYVQESFKMKGVRFTCNSSAGAIMLYDCPTSAVSNCGFFGNYNQSAFSDSSLQYVGSAHAIHVWKSTLALTRSVFHGTGANGATGNGVIDVTGSDGVTGADASAALYMTNVLMNAATRGWFVGNYKGTVEAVNCTFNNLVKPDSNRKYAAYVQHSGSASFLNSIFYNLADEGRFYNPNDGTAPAFADCTDNDVDPLFGDDYFCHPVSPAGRYAGGFFTGGTWVTTDAFVASNVVDKASAFAANAEPQPNGRHVNLGYDGNTEVASKSVLGANPTVSGDALQVFAYPDRAVAGETETTVYGDVAATGVGAEATVTLVWGSSDGGTDKSAWDHTVSCGQHAPWDLVTASIVGASGTVFYRFYAVNANDETAWTDPARTYKVAAKPVIAYASPSVSHRYRTSARVRVDLQENSELDTVVSVAYWPTSDPTLVKSVSANGGAPVPVGVTYAELTGLLPGVEYTCRGEATSSMGTTTLATMTFTTVADDQTMTLSAAPAASGLGDGTDWANAAAIGDVFAQTTAAGDTVRLLQGDYVLAEGLVASNCNGLAIVGGYTGAGDARSGRSRLVRDTSAKGFSVMSFSCSTITVDSVTIEKGFSDVDHSWGQGVRLDNGCDATFTNCVFASNAGTFSTPNHLEGGGIGIKGGALTVVDCEFRDNGAWKYNSFDLWGAGAYAYQATVTVRNSRFRNNYSTAGWNGEYNQHGGALALHECPKAVVDGCTFLTNHVQQSFQMSHVRLSDNCGAGALMAYRCPDVTVRGCRFAGNYNQSAFTAASLKMVGSAHSVRVWDSTMALVDTVFDGEGCGSGAAGNGVVDVTSVSGSARLYMTNVLISAVTKGWCVGSYGTSTTVDVVNCTFADVTASSNSTRTNAVYAQSSGTARFLNTIFWNAPDGEEWIAPGTPEPTNRACAAATALAGERNVVLAESPFAKDDPSTVNLNLQPQPYSLRRNSGCANVGLGSRQLRAFTDLAGGSRVKGGKVDLGAYESDYYRGFLLLVK